MDSNEKLYECLICQERTDHKTSKCPNLICKECGEKGHAKKSCPTNQNCSKCGKNGHSLNDCQEIAKDKRKRSCEECGEEGHSSKDCTKLTCSNCGEKGHSKSECEEIIVEQIVQEKRRGKVLRFSKVTWKGMVEEDSGVKWTFSSTRDLKPGDDVVYDFKDGTVQNVIKLEEMVRAKREKTEINEPPPKMFKQNSRKFQSVGILDIHVIRNPDKGVDHLVQIGMVIEDDQHSQTHFFRAIEPEIQLTKEQEKILNIIQVNNGYILNKAEAEACCSEVKALNDFLEYLELSRKEVALFVSDLDVVMPILMSKFKEYDMVERFAFHVKYLADLKSIVSSKPDYKELKSFCWNKFYLIFEKVNDSSIPCSTDDIWALATAQLIWITTRDILGVENLVECVEFSNYTVQSRLKMNSQRSLSTGITKEPITYCSSIFKRNFQERK